MTKTNNDVRKCFSEASTACPVVFPKRNESKND
jgi:hypothetical protein